MLEPEHSPKQFQLRPSKTRIPGKENDGRSVRYSVPQGLEKSFGQSLIAQLSTLQGLLALPEGSQKHGIRLGIWVDPTGAFSGLAPSKIAPIHNRRLNMSLKIHLLHVPASIVEVACRVAEGRPIERS